MEKLKKILLTEHTININKNNIIYVYIMINVIYNLVGSFLARYYIGHSSFSLTLIVPLIINIIIITIANIKKKVKRNIIDYLALGLIIFAIISTIFSVRPTISLYGTMFRNEGIFQLMYYYTLLIVSTYIKNKKHKENIINMIIYTGIIQAIYTIIQVTDTLKFIKIPNRGTNLGTGLTTCANFYGTLSLICLTLSIGKFIYKRMSKFQTIINLIITIILYVGLLISNTLSALVGLICSIIVLIIYYIYNKYKKNIESHETKKHILLLIFFIITSIIVTTCKKTNLFNDFIKFSNETANIVNKKVDESYGTNRLYIWKTSIDNLPNHYLHGTGVDCFFYVNETGLMSKNGKEYYDKAHNEYLQIATTEGIFALTNYLILLTVIIINGYKTNKKKKDCINIALLIAFIGYIAQATFNISVIEVAPLFYIVSGLLYDRYYKKV